MKWTKAIEKTVKSEGSQILFDVLKTRGQSANEGTKALAPPTRSGMTKWLKRGREELTHAKKIPQSLQSLTKEEWKKVGKALVGRTLHSTLFLGGAWIGFWIPRWDLKLIRARSPLNRIFLPSLPFLTWEIGTDWLIRILERSANHPDLPSTEKQVLNNLMRSVTQLSRGARIGSGVDLLPRLLRRRKKNEGISLSDPAYQALEQLFSTLAAIAKKG